MSGTVFLEASELSVFESDGLVRVAILRTGDLSQDVTVEYQITLDTADAADVGALGVGTIIIPAGDGRVILPIDIIDDDLAEPTESLVVSIIAVDSGELLFPRTTRIDILDDENPVLPPTNPPLISDYDVTEVEVFSGLVQPIAFEFMPTDDTLFFVAEKGGTISLRDFSTGTTIATVLDLTQQVNNVGDRGLLDIALYPDFETSPYLYAFYVVDPPDVAGNTGRAGPDGDGNRFSHLVRFELDPATGYSTVVPGSETVLLGAGGQSLSDISGGGALNFTQTSTFGLPASEIDPETGDYKQDYLKVDSLSHAGGALEFGPDGALYVSTGDGTSYNAADPRTVSVLDTGSLSGKILRIDPITGLGMPDNPFVDAAGGDLSQNAAKVYQLGLRNPYSMSFDAEGKLFIANTGWYEYEAIFNGEPGANFGWPFFEGGDNGQLERAPGYQDFPEAQAFYDAVDAGDITITPAYRGFSHASSDPGFQLQAITGADDIITSDLLPASLQGHYIFTDVVQGEVYSISTDDRREVEFLYQSSGPYAPVHFKQGPDGLIYYADLVLGTIGRLDISERDLTGLTFTFGDSAYEVLGTAPTWQDAQDAAVAAGGTLVHIGSQAENDFITSVLFRDRAIFVDASDADVEGVWAGSDGAVLTYTNWASGQPGNSPDADFARIWDALGRWSDGVNSDTSLYEDGTLVSDRDGLVVVERDIPQTTFFWNNRQYDILGTAATWTEAQSLAEAEGEDVRLLSIGSQAEQDFVMSTLWQGATIFLGTTDAAVEGTWLDAYGAPQTYFNWLTGQPNDPDGTEDYARIASASGGWADGDPALTTVFTDQGRIDSGVGLVVAERPAVFAFGNSTYELAGALDSWADAQSLAASRGGRLLGIESRAENDYIMSVFWADQAIFLDASDAVTEGVFTDSDGDPLGFTNWRPGEPNDFGGIQDYARIADPEGRWDDGWDGSTAWRSADGWTGDTAMVIIEFSSDAVFTFAGKTYEAIGVAATWTEAKAAAEAAGGTLVGIESQAENDFIMATFWDDRAIFLDANDAAEEGAFVDSDGQALTFGNWRPGEPNDFGGNQDYARIADPEGRWDDGRDGSTAWRDGTSWVTDGAALVVVEKSDTITYGASRYEVLGTAERWTDAKALAEAAGGRLLGIESVGENDFVMATFWDNRAIFLDANDVAVEGTFVDSAGQTLVYGNWRPGEPNDFGGNQDYARIADPEGRWDDGRDGSTAWRDVDSWETDGAALVIVEYTDEFDLV